MQNAKLNSSELGSLWLTYQKKTMILRVLEYFSQQADDPKGKSLMTRLHKKLHVKVIELKTILENAGAAIPEGFTEKDINLQAPKLWDNGFDIMFSRILIEISVGLYALHLTMSYRKDIISFYQDLSKLSETYYGHFKNICLITIFYPARTLCSCRKRLVMFQIKPMQKARTSWVISVN